MRQIDLWIDYTLVLLPISQVSIGQDPIEGKQVRAQSVKIMIHSIMTTQIDD